MFEYFILFGTKKNLLNMQEMKEGGSGSHVEYANMIRNPSHVKGSLFKMDVLQYSIGCLFLTYIEQTF